MVGLYDLRGLSQLKWFCDSVLWFQLLLLFIIYLSKVLHSCAKEHAASAESVLGKKMWV